MSSYGLSESCRHKRGHGQLDTIVMRNTPPKWNEQLSAYCLNFKGRVTQASVKNFQLVSEADAHAVLLQFGKVGHIRQFLRMTLVPKHIKPPEATL